MHAIAPNRKTSLPRRHRWIGLFALLATTWGPLPAGAHELWVETDGKAEPGAAHGIRICWGHAGHKEAGQSLKRQESRIRAWLLRPGEQTQRLDLATGPDSFTTTINPEAAGWYWIGAELQVGILTKEFHGIPANTRMVMYGKSFTRLRGDAQGLTTPLGAPMEIVPLTDPEELGPGKVLAVKVLFKEKPLADTQATATLTTLGKGAFPQDPRVQGAHWSCQGDVDPRTGEVAFPLIVAGQHLVQVRYMDETPGRYEGNAEVATQFSHLRKGDSFERTLYVCTLTLDVKAP